MMSMSSLLIAALLFLVFAFIQALFINGIKAASEGTFEIMPSGKRRYKGMIFYPVAEYLTRTKLEKQFYSVKGYKLLIELIENKYPDFVMPTWMQYATFYHPNKSSSRARVMVNLQDEGERKAAEQFAKYLLMKEGIDHVINQEGWIEFFKPVTVNIQPAILRKPIIECVKCMASFWGALTYWPVVTSVFGFHYWELPVFAFDVIILVYLNFYYHKQLLR
jgi:hypothetical protein